MLWLFQRRGEYLSCEVRTCLRNSGFELCILHSNGQSIEWYPDERSVQARWEQLKGDLKEAGWCDLHASASA